ncbi:MAG: GMC family oxidoreductase N-terminal domain-containing protein, partial [Pseudolabrys sp.]
MTLGRVVGGGSSVNAMVWTRGLERDYERWEREGATGWGFKEVLPTFKAQEDWEGGANDWRGAGGPVRVRTPRDPHPTAPAFLDAARQMGFPVLEDLNGPMRAGAGYINMNIGADGTRASSARCFLRPNLGRSNLTLLLNAHATKVLFKGDRASGIEVVSGDTAENVGATREVILSAGTIHSCQIADAVRRWGRSGAAKVGNRSRGQSARSWPEPPGPCTPVWRRLLLQEANARPPR